LKLNIFSHQLLIKCDPLLLIETQILRVSYGFMRVYLRCTGRWAWFWKRVRMGWGVCNYTKWLRRIRSVGFAELLTRSELN